MKQGLDTPRENSWAQQVNQPGFIPTTSRPKAVRLRTISAEEARTLIPVFNGSR